MPGTGGPRVIQGVGFWAQQPYFVSVAAGAFIFRAPLRGLPEQPPPPNAFQSWTFSLPQWRLIPPFRQSDWPLPIPPPRLDQTWTQSFRLAQFITTGVTLRPPLKGLPEQPVPLLQQWTFRNFNTLQPTVVTLIIRQSDWPLSFAPQQPAQTWTWQYNLNLIGQDAMLVGEQRYELAPSQVVPDQIQLRSWQWSYNLSLIGKDRLPTGEQVYDLAPSQRTPEQIQLHSWSWTYNLSLIGKDQLPTGAQISDLAPAQRPPEQIQLHSWSWQYNVNLIGQDRMIVGKQVHDRPTLAIPPAALTWTYQYNPNLIGQDQLPFRQRDWPIPIAAQQPAFSWVDVTKIWLTVPTLNLTISQYWDRPQLPTPLAQTWTWQYNLNLIGQDRFPTGEQIYDRPTLPIPPAQTWLDLPKYSLIAKPFLQVDWPNPTQPYRLEQTWVRGYNLNLIGQDQLPFRQQDWPLPQVARQPAQTWTDPSKIWLTAPVLNITISQYFDRPQLPVPPAQTWTASYLLSLIGQDQLPNRQQDWPLTPAQGRSADLATWIDRTKFILQRPTAQLDWPNPTPPAREPSLNSFAGRYNLDLIGQDRLPFNQRDWPLSTAHALSQIPLQIMVAGKPFFLVPVQPLPPGVQFHGILYDRFIDPRGAAADITNPAWRWPQITPPPVTGVIPLRTLMGTGV